MTAPPPMTPADSDLQDFAFMPLHVSRLRDSDMAAQCDPEACWYAVLLWCASWHQLPAGSLPTDDASLTRLVGLGRDLRTWRKHKADALRGWALCTDGRLYHPVVAEQVAQSWRKKLEQRWRTECARIKKANQRAEEGCAPLPVPSLDEFLARRAAGQGGDSRNPVPELSLGTAAIVPEEIVSKRQGQGQGQGQRDSYSDAIASGAAADAAEDTAEIVHQAVLVSPAPAFQASADRSGSRALDPAKLMFDSGVALLVGSGRQERAGRALIGKWKQAYGAPAVIDAISRAHREGAEEPVSFIEGCLRNGQSNGNRARHGRGEGGRGNGIFDAIVECERDARAEPHLSAEPSL